MSGIAGEREEIIRGHIKAMRSTITFNIFGENAIGLCTPVEHQIDLREVQQTRNQTAGKVELMGVKHIMVVTPVKVSLGKLENGTTSNPSGEYAVSYYAMYRNGQREIELDPTGYVCYIHGVDYLEDVRKAMGL